MYAPTSNNKNEEEAYKMEFRMKVLLEARPTSSGGGLFGNSAKC